MRRLIRDAARTARVRRQGRLVRVATYNVRTMAVKGANGYGRADSVLHEAAKQGISFVGLQEVRRPGRTEFAASGFRVPQRVVRMASESLWRKRCARLPGTPRSTLTSASWL